MNNRELEYSVYNRYKDSCSIASFLMPVIRVELRKHQFDKFCFKENNSISNELFTAQYGTENTSWITYDSLENMHQKILELPDNVKIVGVEKCGVFFGISDADNCQKSRMDGRVIIVTGAARGLGREIAEILLENGSYVVLADINGDQLAVEVAKLTDKFGEDRCTAIQTDVSDAISVENLCRETVLRFGGIDVMFSNAGVVIPGSLEVMDADKLRKVMDVNYIGYFHCAKYASRYMKIQSAFDANYTADIINTSSISGLIGYQKNFAYCGSKFAVIGLTSCFAKELIGYRIKVNSICPGNYLDGPLWSDPEKGLFKQYFEAGKVAGAKTVQDSIDYYTNREPFKRGAHPEDIACAVMYAIEQQFESGIAIPVSGGLAMGQI